MLQRIRDNSQSAIAKGIVALMIVPFVFFGIDSFFQGGGDKNVAEVNGTEISERELLYGIDTRKRQLQAQLGESYDPNMINDAMLKPQVLESLVQRELFKIKADDLGIVASDALLDQQIVESPEFQENGQFSKLRYEGLLRSNGLLPSGHRDQLRTQITANHLVSGLAQSDFATMADVGVTAKVTDQRRDVRFIRVPAVAEADISEVDDAAIKAYYDANQQRFMRPDQVQLEYLQLSLSDFYADVSEADVREVYEREKSAYEPEQERSIAHILVAIEDQDNRSAAESRIAEVQAKLTAGADFADLAGEYSDDGGSADAGGMLGLVGVGLFPEFDEALEAMTAGDVSQVVETESGLHLIKLIEETTTEFPAYEARRERIENDLKAATATPDYIARIEELEDATFGADDLSLAAEEFEIPLQLTEFFDRNAGSGVASQSAVRNLAFSDEFLSAGQNSEAIELGEESVVIIRLKEFRTATPRPLIEVSDSIRSNLLADSLRKATGEKAQAILDQLQLGGSVEDTAKSLGVDWQVELEAERNSLSLDRPITEATFTAEEFSNGRALVIAELANGDNAVVEVSNVQPGNTKRIPSRQRQALQQSIAQMSGNRAFDDYFKAVRAAADVNIP
ncbi:MAG: SurA N-terminal domain-containing protein [Pseudomonadales bacterium]